MHVLYWSMIGLQSLIGSFDLENSIQSSRRAFSSLQTQHGYILICQPLTRRGDAKNQACERSGGIRTLGLEAVALAFVMGDGAAVSALDGIEATELAEHRKGEREGHTNRDR
jgi:hypothetical protein